MKDLNLKTGEMMLVSAKAVNGGKVSLEFAQNLTSGVNLVSLLNASDERFNQNGPRRAWMTGMPADIKKVFNIETASLKEGEVLEIGQLNPTISGERLNIQIVETTKGTAYDVENFTERAKRAGKDGDFITTVDGEFIYQILTVVVGEPKNVFIKETSRRATGSSVTSSAIEEALESAK